MSRQPSDILGRIRQVQRAMTGSSSTARPSNAPQAPSAGGQEDLSGQVADLRTRLAHLEQLVQGLQDSVHRGSERHEKRMSDMEKRLDPAALAAALDNDARERGL